MKDLQKKLDSLVAKYKEEMLVVNERRKEWQERVKPLILSILEDFVKKDELPCEVGVNSNFKNMEVVYLAFQNEDSGIANNHNQQIFTKTGGGLMYAQQANGKVNSFIILPFIENIKGDKNDTQEINSCHISDINEEMIKGDLITFLQKLLDWECLLREPIGFKM